MKSKKYDIIFLSLARNCEGSLKFFFNFLKELKNQGNEVFSIIGENGSEDYTFDEIVDILLADHIVLTATPPSPQYAAIPTQLIFKIKKTSAY